MLFRMNYSDWEELFSLSAAALWPRLGEASAVRERHFGRQVSFCVIINAKSGLCSEDCAFCSQSARATSQVDHYPLLPREELVAAAEQAAAAGASRFSLVTAGRGVAVAPGSERHSGGGGRHQSGRAHPGLRLPGDCGPGLPDGVEGRGAVPFSPQPGDRGLIFPPDLHHPQLCRAGGHHRSGPGGRVDRVRRGDLRVG